MVMVGIPECMSRGSSSYLMTENLLYILGTRLGFIFDSSFSMFYLPFPCIFLFLSGIF